MEWTKSKCKGDPNHQKQKEGLAKGSLSTFIIGCMHLLEPKK